MTTVESRAHESNPFSAERIRPGALPFFFPAGVTPASLWEQFRQSGYRGQIVGPHGSGKTSLLKALIAGPPWKDFLGNVYFLRNRNELTDLADEERCAFKPDRLWTKIRSMTAGSLVIVDGFDQIRFAGRLLFILQARYRRLKFLATTHRPFLLPTILRLNPDLDLAYEIARHCLSEAARWRLAHGLNPINIPAELVHKLYFEANGNIRELLFSLYDVYEVCSRQMGEACDNGSKPYSPRSEYFDSTS
ncbi:MAG: hypothetical protein NZ899_01710 [Thermoguttaceae bacterium]|nr:hypothetical protein [Thermoguttaceae bacterium]MDW8078652.1 hypothetical protein [Thermoguttaceae bacterium]